MSFLKRLGFFIFGLSIGIVFLTFFFKNKAKETGSEFCYLPNCRVLKDLRSKSYSYSDEVTAMMASGEIDSLTIKSFFTDGDVDFNKSDTKSKPCKTYVIEHENTKNEVQFLTVTNCPKKIVIEKITE
ncbi:DUF4258 domain-containing protein [Cellulophaga baltica]|uniref:DUF4258 domain-containing protein n=1 Tax=Cellulophaga TaxID=104264 RepID=UPI001C064B30|nr:MULTISPECIES: DUF4258 domain-containing protein [Cellulophaga]MBU2996188.1 DUF4258 domain-containing protein [Cellulophaga baltica]MDO6767583.1 DUF4258 domain-containing protein [Cellulophaga sp. 1_MG-2023]